MQKLEAKSYGVIPIFKNKDGFYILLVKNSKGGHWGLPKGTPEKDEKPIDTAKRELAEETGIRDIEIKIEPTLEEKYDFDELKWVKIDEAQNTLTHQSAIDVIKKLAELLK